VIYDTLTDIQCNFTAYLQTSQTPDDFNKLRTTTERDLALLKAVLANYKKDNTRMYDKITYSQGILLDFIERIKGEIDQDGTSQLNPQTEVGKAFLGVRKAWAVRVTVADGFQKDLDKLTTQFAALSNAKGDDPALVKSIAVDATSAVKKL
jgi:hypothetical protein